MANSDNVLRGGLTGKHMDLGELKSVLSFSSSEPDMIRSEPDGNGLEQYFTPAREFELKRFSGGRGRLPGGVPAVILVTSGTLGINCANEVKVCGKGGSVFIPAACAVDLSGEGEAYIACLPAGK
jgi:mannose-6-phosphate isomerase